MRLPFRPIHSCPSSYVIRHVWALVGALVVLGWLDSGRGWALDPPHLEDCVSCHAPHGAAGGVLTTASGNANVCQSCHTAGGGASAKPLPNSSQAWPWPGLPAGTNAAGTSHRWDAGAAGHVVFLGGAATASTGTLMAGGAYTGIYPKTYTITMVSAGNVGAARFNWTATSPGGGGASNLVAGTNVVLNEGVRALFQDGPGVSFQANDRWQVYARADLRHPTNYTLLERLSEGQVVCSTCHNEHSQTNAPFDPKAPAYGGAGTGVGRHFMRVNNDVEQMCVDCHAPRNVTNAVAGSHPVGLAFVTNAAYKLTTNLPLEKVTGKIRCLTCHKVHFAPANDGDLLVMTNGSALCGECHRLANTTTPGAHFAGTNTALLWPGGQYGSTFPARASAGDRASCVNCHAPHGWPNATNTATRYPKLLVEQEENLCLTCHDSNGPAGKNVLTDLAKAVHHPVGDADLWRRPNRSVECEDCHNPHLAQAGAHTYTNTATAARNQVSNPLKGVAGVAVNYSGLTNFQTVATNLYTVLPKGSSLTTNPGATNEYQVCFKCHTAYAFGSTPPPGLTPVYNTGTASFTNGSATVTGTGTSWNSGMVGLWVYLASRPSVVYRVTAVASTTSLTITPAYAGTTASGQSYHLSGATDLAQEFSPRNRSGHPIVTGLDNYPNSTAVGSPARKGLQAAALKAPWNVNVGQQTMTCSDCHNTDAATPAAQGPHGSAAQFLLRGANAANWPNVQNSAFSTSWCANCHNNTSSTVHGGNHNGTRCYVCHIVIPHGGKLSRLIADGNSAMPVRYAYNNTLSSVGMTQFRKAASGSYTENNNCRTSCGHHGSGTGNEDW